MWAVSPETEIDPYFTCLVGLLVWKEKTIIFFSKSMGHINLGICGLALFISATIPRIYINYVYVYVVSR